MDEGMKASLVAKWAEDFLHRPARETAAMEAFFASVTGLLVGWCLGLLAAVVAAS